MTLKRCFKRLTIIMFALFISFTLIACGESEDRKLLNEALDSIAVGNTNNVAGHFKLRNTTIKQNLEIEWSVKSTDGGLALGDLIDVEGATYKEQIFLVTQSKYTEDDKGEQNNPWRTAELTAKVKIGKETGTRVWDVHITPGAQIYTISELLTTATIGSQISVKGVVYALFGTEGCFIKDGTGYMYIYTKPECEVGDEVLVKGEYTLYYGQPEITKATYEVISLAKQEIDYDDFAETMTITELANIDSTVLSNYAKLVKVEGQIIKDPKSLADGATVDSSCPYGIMDVKTGKYIAIYRSNATTYADLLDKYVELYMIVNSKHSSYWFWRNIVVEGTIKEATAPTLTDAERVAVAKSTLITQFNNKDAMSDVTLPLTDNNYPGLTISWVSNKPTVIANDGTYVSPAEATEVEFTVTITLNSVTETIAIVIIAKPANPITISEFIDPSIEANTLVRVEGQVYSIPINGNNGGIVLSDGVNCALIFRPGEFTCKVGDIVVVTATKGIYNNIIQLQGATIEVKIPATSETKLDYSNTPTKTVSEILALSQTDTASFNKLFKVEGYIRELPDGAYTNMYLVDEDGNQIMFHYHGLNADELAKIKAMDGEYKVIYAYTYQIYSNNHTLLYFLDSAVDGDEPEISDQDKVNMTKTWLGTQFAANMEVFGNLILPIKGSIYTDVTITWVSDKVTIINNDGKLVAPSTDTDVKLTATLTLGTITVAFEVTVKAKALQVQTVKQAIDACDVAYGTPVTIKTMGYVVGFGDSGDHFYLADATGVLYIRLNNASVTIPTGMKVGDKVEIIGNAQVYHATNSRYVRQVIVMDKDNIKMLDDSIVVTSPVDPAVTALSEFSTKNNKEAVAATSIFGKQVEITGKVEVEGTSYYLVDGTNKIWLQGKTKAELADLKDQTITVVGVVYGYYFTYNSAPVNLWYIDYFNIVTN